MRLIERIQRLEVSPAGGSDIIDEVIAYMAAMSDKDLGHVLRNLMVATPPPEDPALAALWERAIAGGLDALTDDENGQLLAWVDSWQA